MLRRIEFLQAFVHTSVLVNNFVQQIVNFSRKENFEQSPIFKLHSSETECILSFSLPIYIWVRVSALHLSELGSRVCCSDFSLLSSRSIFSCLFFCFWLKVYRPTYNLLCVSRKCTLTTQRGPLFNNNQEISFSLCIIVEKITMFVHRC